jgi:hypothetical protein
MRGSITSRGAGQLAALGEAIVDHAETELELGGQGLELIEAVPVRPQAAVLQHAAVSQHRQTQQARLREQPLDVLGQDILGLRHGVAPLPISDRLAPSCFGAALIAWGMPRAMGRKCLESLGIAATSTGGDRQDDASPVRVRTAQGLRAPHRAGREPGHRNVIF